MVAMLLFAYCERSVLFFFANELHIAKCIDWRAKPVRTCRRSIISVCENEIAIDSPSVL